MEASWKMCEVDSFVCFEFGSCKFFLRVGERRKAKKEDWKI
jgi:hypothetical protein